MTKEEFLKDIDGWCNHRHLLWPALEATKHTGLPVLELGAGLGSTPYLRKYCEANGIEFFSYDYNKEWAFNMGARHVSDWSELDPFWGNHYAVALVDESPGEHRKESIRLLTNTKVIIVHDSEPIGWNASDYQVRPLFNKFKYVKDLESEQKGGAWASWLSNEFIWP